MEFIPVLGRQVPEDAYNLIVELYLSGKSVEYIVKKIVKISEVSTDFVVDGMVREILRREVHDKKMIPTPQETQNPEPFDPVEAKKNAVKAHKAAIKAYDRATIDVLMAEMELDRVETQVSVFSAVQNPTDERRAKRTPINPRNIDVGPLLADAVRQRDEVQSEVERVRMVLELRRFSLND